MFKTKTKLSAFNKSDILVLGKVKVLVEYEDKSFHQIFYIVDSDRNNIYGRDLMKNLGIKLSIDDKSINNISVKDMLSDYAKRVDKKNTVKDFEAKLTLKDNTVPKFFKPRSVPYHYRKLVEDALTELENDGVIVPVSHSEWASPICPVLKSNNKIRLCVDFKYVNSQLCFDTFPLPKLEDIFTNLDKSACFSKTDLSNAYLQLPVSEECQNILVMSTHKGLFKLIGFLLDCQAVWVFSSAT